MRFLCLAACTSLALGFASGLLGGSTAHAQTEWTASAGGWIPFLPEYRAISDVSGGGATIERQNIFEQDTADLGGQLGLRVLHHFGGTLTSLEARASIAGLETESRGSGFADPATSTIWMASLDGNNFLATPPNTTIRFDLDSDVFFHDEYIGLRDRFDFTDWGIGEVFIGCGFSHMRFDQDYRLHGVISDGARGLYAENLESNFLGGQIVSTITREIFGHRVLLDTNIGFYNVDADYNGSTRLADNGGNVYHTDRVILEHSEGATTVDLALRTDLYFSSVLVRPMIGMKYISDMPSIVHPQTEIVSGGQPVLLSTDSAYLLNFGLEILL
jgi:hypothetical protein